MIIAKYLHFQEITLQEIEISASQFIFFHLKLLFELIHKQ